MDKLQIDVVGRENQDEGSDSGISDNDDEASVGDVDDDF